jgi:DNA polymerase elongation subunit (family B)
MDALVFDIETHSLNVNEAQVKWFGAYSYKNDKYYLLDYRKNCEIKDLIKSHKYLIGFNNKSYDQPILENFGVNFDYKIILDLYQISAPKGKGEHGKFNKGKLPQTGVKLKSYSLKNIIEALKLDKDSKGDIDYKIFKKDDWTEKEIKEIKKYLKQDIDLTKKLYEWYEETFKPLKKLLPSEDVRKLKHLKTSFSSLGYNIICSQANLPVEWEEKKPENLKSFSGGHHINPRWNLVKGNIIEIDFSSAYPHALIMGNLFSPKKDGWAGADYYNVEGVYDNKEQGKIEKALHLLMTERLKAKKEKDRAKNLSYKLIINSIYGLTGNYVFKSLYNPTTASDCTSIVRTWMKKLAKTLEENEFTCLYGFTDSIYVKVPSESNKEELMMIVDKFIKEATSKMPFPVKTFNMDVEVELKMIWFVAKNCYLFVTKDNEVSHTSTLLNTNTPKSVMEVFKKYIQAKIIKELDVKFTQKELEEQLQKLFKKDYKLSAQEYKVSDISEYKSKTSIQYQISEVYGDGRHFLIPNLKGVGIGKAKTTKTKVGVRYCNFEQFKDNKLKVEDIDTSQLMKHLKPFIGVKQ